jgi:DNA ligase (NAD+)
VKAIDELTQAEAEIEIESLKRDIALHDDLYYNRQSPLIGDFEYDLLRRRLLEIESRFENLVSSDSPSRVIGAPVSGHLPKVFHANPMLSLDNAFGREDVEHFLDRVSKLLDSTNTIDLCVEHKIDGLSASIIYKDGEMKRGATRGDGFAGEDITPNLKTVKSAPHKIKLNKNCEIRGEIYMSKKSFKILNKKREAIGEQLFANPRNAASGSIRQLNPSITSSRDLKFFAYYLNIFGDNYAPKSQLENLSILSSLGFAVPEHRRCANVGEVISYYDYMIESRQDLPYEIDGLVLKVNSLDLQEKLGFVSRHPRHSIAIKFPASEAKTRVKDISVNVGRSGKITPIAILEPVSISGIVVSKATLHNFEEIKRIGVERNDMVTVQRAGDVIPKIVSVDHSKRDGSSAPFDIPCVCPSCGTGLVKYPGLSELYCPNHNRCQGQTVMYISYFISKSCFNIIGLGECQIEELIREGRIVSAVDIFRLKEKDAESPLAKKKGWGHTSATKLFDSIERARIISLPRFITALGIHGVGEAISLELSSNFGTLDALINAPIESLLEIAGLGPIISQKIYDFFRNKVQIHFIKELMQYVSVEPYHKKVETDIKSMFYGKVVVFTGRLRGLSRQAAKQIAISFGASVGSSISSKTDFLVVGEEGGEEKVRRARELGVPVISESEFMIDSSREGITDDTS